MTAPKRCAHGRSGQPAASSPDDAPEERADAAVDVSLIDEMLRLEPLERLRQNERMLRTIARLRSAFARRRGRDERAT